MVRERVRVPGTEMYLVYVSSQAAGYMSTLLVRLTSRRPPADLLVVRLRVVVEGVQSEQVLAAQPSLTYTFAWNKHNAYNQKVYGLTSAISTLIQPFTAPRVTLCMSMTIVTDRLCPVCGQKYDDSNVRTTFVCSTSILI